MSLTLVACASDTELRFGLLEELARSIHKWEKAQDAIVFEKQVATGTFNGKTKLEKFIWEGLKTRHASGEIRPYYGAIGGSCAYELRVDVPHSIVKVTNDLLEEPFEISVATQIVKPAITDEAKGAGKRGHRDDGLFSSAPIRFKIAGNELDKLRAWKCWKQEKCLAGRYVYRFCSTSLGDVMKITDTTTGEMIDVSDYDHW